MIRNLVWLAVVWAIGFSPTIEQSFAGAKANPAKKIDKAVRKYQRFVKADKLEKARKIAQKTAKRHPKSPAAQLLIEHSELLSAVQSASDIQPANHAKTATQPVRKDQIVAQMLIVEVPDHFFERVGIDFDFAVPNPPKPHAGIQPRPLPRPASGNPAVELVSYQEQKPVAIVSPRAKDFLLKSLGDDCNVLSRPQIRTLDGQPAEIQIHSGDEVGIDVKLVADVSKNRKELSLKIDGNSQGEKSHVEAKVASGQTLLVHLGTHIVEAEVERKLPLLEKVPSVDRLFRSKAIARESRSRLVFITPRIVRD